MLNLLCISKEEAFGNKIFGMKWFQDGDSNTKFFHTIMNNKRRRLILKKIKKDDNTWIEGSDEIAKEAINFFESQFSKDDSHKDFSILNCLPCVINEEDNNILDALPTMAELKEAVFSLSADSAPGPDGTPLPRSFTHSCLILIPKTPNPQRFTDLRPISLSNFSSKIISKMLNTKTA
ncbi:hypothetical protein H5410_054944 [Solanum commersonii]|uniref:Uncharacterized protein n=1 Tax=Solanum commersonii TaxID=4109 RepID=A0A9J5WGR9_SOLCO|nr:hypothetical protein H5410_054944 [Solanum commersonii]